MEYQTLYGVDAGRAAFEQEYECSFNAMLLGAMYGHDMAMLRAEDRISDTIVAEPDQYVHRAWDLGVRDDTAIFWWQNVGGQLFVLDCYSASGHGLDHYVEVIEDRHRRNGWLHGHDYVPHDAKVKEFGTGKTRVETMRTLGLSPLLVPLSTMQDGVNAVRRTLPMAVFHTRCEAGIAALEQYQREWDDENKCFKLTPLHDWTSNYADAFRYLAQAWRGAPRRDAKQPALTGWTIPPPSEPQRGRIIL